MPKNLTNDHLQWMTEAFTKVSLWIEENDGWPNRVITKNESWVFQYEASDKAAQHVQGISRLAQPQESADLKIRGHDNIDLSAKQQCTKACHTLSDCQPEVLTPSCRTHETMGCSLCEAIIAPQWVDSAWWKCTLTHNAFSQGIFGEKIYCGRGTSYLLTTSCSIWLLPLPYHGESTKGITFWKPSKGSEAYNDYSK